MARYTTAYSRFIHRIAEIESILSVAHNIEKSGVTRSTLEQTNGLCRGAIVLLCSHIEGYIEDLVSLGVVSVAENQVPKNTLSPSFKYHLSRDLLADISGSTDPNTIASKVEAFLSRDVHIWDSSAVFSPPLPVETFVGRFATPTHENIRRFFRQFGYSTFQSDLAFQLRSNFPICTNMVDQVVAQRNKIAHGDVLAYGTPTDLEEMCSLVRLYCRQTDHVVGNWFRGKGCSIRS